MVQLSCLGTLIDHYGFGGTENLTKSASLTFRAIMRALNHDDLAHERPLDIDTMARDFRLPPECVTQVMCKKCFAVYPLDTARELCPSDYEDPPNVCNTPLFKTARGGSKREPILKYAYQPLANWLSRMLSRADIEPHLRDYTDHRYQENAEMEDIWDSPKWWSFADGFVKCDDDRRLKLMFGLGMDGFNPFSNKQAKQVSFGFCFPLRAYESNNLYSIVRPLPFILCFSTSRPIFDI